MFELTFVMKSFSIIVTLAMLFQDKNEIGVTVMNHPTLSKIDFSYFINQTLLNFLIEYTF